MVYVVKIVGMPVVLSIVPSPSKSHSYCWIVPSGSLLPLASKVTSSGASPSVLSGVITAVGAWLPPKVYTIPNAVSVSPPSSVTRTYCRCSPPVL